MSYVKGDLGTHPISRIEWVDVNRMEANDWNPNHVMEPEMRLLAFSIISQGWIQPILVWPDPDSGKLVIIDGFHRHLVMKTNKEVWAMTGGMVPVVIMDMTKQDRMLLTIRINRAKGSHSAFKMHKIVNYLLTDGGLTPQEVAKQIGADISEVNLLVQEGVFENKQVATTNYSKAWFPKGIKEHGIVEACHG